MKFIHLNTFCFFSLLFLFISSSAILSQSDIRKGFKVGIELKNYITEDIGTFNKSFGFTFGGFTGIKIYSFDKGTLLLRTELNFIKLQHHRPEQIYSNWYDSSFTVIDEKFTFGFLEFALMPTYHFNLDAKTSFDIFIGPSIGLGNKGLETKQINDVPLSYDPYDEYTMGFVQPTSLNVGVSFYYKPLVFDIRYRYDYLGGISRFNELTNLFFQIGIGL